MSTHRASVSAALREHARRAEAELGVFTTMGAAHAFDVMPRCTCDLLQETLQNRGQDAGNTSGAWRFSRSTD